MKKLEIITSDRILPDVYSTLREANVGGITYYRVEGRGRKIQQFTTKYKVEVVVRDGQVEDLINRILNKIRGNVTGGKIFVTDVPMAVDLAENKKGEDAI